MDTKKNILEFENQILRSVKSSIEFSSKSKDPKIENVEDFLLKVAKYPILASQLNGYFPLAIRKDSSNPTFHRLTSSFISFPFIYCLLQVLSFPLIIVKFSSLASSFVASMAKGVESDSVTLKVLAGLYMANPLIHRILGILRSKRALQFWKTNCSLLENIFLDNESLFIHSKDISKLKRGLRFVFFEILALIFIGSVSFSYLGPLFNLLGIEKETGGSMSNFVMNIDITGQLVFLILPMFGFSHPLSVTYVNLFPKLYSVSLRVITEKLKSISITPENVLDSTEPFLIKETFGRLSNRKSKIISQHEEISRVVEMYENIVNLTKEFNSHYGARLLGEVVYSMLSILGFTYFVVIWTADGRYSSSCCVAFPVIMSLAEMFALGSVGTELKQRSNEVLDALQDLNPEDMSPNTQWKVKMLISRINTHPLELSPGNYFVLNKSCLVSVLSFMISSLIVLAQFRDN